MLNHTGGYLRPQIWHNLLENSNRYVADAAAEVFDFELAHFSVIQEVIKKHDIDCDFTMTRSFDITAEESLAEKTSAAYEELAKVLPDRAAEVQYTSSDNAGAVSPSPPNFLPPLAKEYLKPPDLRR